MSSFVGLSCLSRLNHNKYICTKPVTSHSTGQYNLQFEKVTLRVMALKSRQTAHLSLVSISFKVIFQTVLGLLFVLPSSQTQTILSALSLHQQEKELQHSIYNLLLLYYGYRGYVWLYIWLQDKALRDRRACYF